MIVAARMLLDRTHSGGRLQPAAQGDWNFDLATAVEAAERARYVRPEYGKRRALPVDLGHGNLHSAKMAHQELSGLEA